MKARAPAIFVPVAIVLLSVLAYLPALRAGFIWDDDVHVTQNYNLRTAEGLWRIWTDPQSSPQYYPLAHTLFWLEYQTWGPWAAGDHAVNVLLHATNAVLVWLVLRRLRVPGSWLGALLFAIHPVEVETVAWVMEAKTLLSTLFYLLAMLCCLQFWKIDADDGESANWRIYGLAIFCFVLSLLSKSVTATLPAAFLVILWWKRGRIGARDIALLLPMFLLGAASGLYTAALERTHVGAEGAEWALSLMDRVLIAGRALWFYAGKLVWPRPLIFFYPRWTIDARLWWQYLFPLAAMAVVWLLWLKRRQLGRGPLAAVLFFGLTLGPALGFLNFYPMRYSFVADHFQYLACVGLLALAGALLHRWMGTHRAFRILAIVAALPLFFTTFARCFAYHDAWTLYHDIVAKDPDSWGGQALLAQEYQKRGDYPRAAAHFAEANRLNPHVVENAEGLGDALVGMHRTDEAIAILSDVVKRDPARAKGYNDLAGAYLQRGDTAQAMSLYQEALQRDPRLSEAHFNFANLLAGTGHFAEAASEFSQALTLRPDWAEAALNAGRCLASAGRLAEAQPYFETALRLRPGWRDARQDLQRLHNALHRGP
ncbi:MAG: tetratricopeptide repeat protein [Phycisphaerae bacterium]